MRTGGRGTYRSTAQEPLAELHGNDMMQLIWAYVSTIPIMLEMRNATMKPGSVREGKSCMKVLYWLDPTKRRNAGTQRITPL